RMSATLYGTVRPGRSVVRLTVCGARVTTLTASTGAACGGGPLEPQPESETARVRTTPARYPFAVPPVLTLAAIMARTHPWTPYSTLVSIDSILQPVRPPDLCAHVVLVATHWEGGRTSTAVGASGGDPTQDGSGAQPAARR